MPDSSSPGFRINMPIMVPPHTALLGSDEEMLPQEEASIENLMSAFIKVLQTLSYPDSEEEEVRKILKSAE